MTVTEAARAYGVTGKTIGNWMARGLPFSYHANGDWKDIDPEKLRKWVDANVDLSGAGHGGAREGGGRPPASGGTKPAAAPAFELGDGEKFPTSVEDLDRQQDAGTLTKSNLTLAEKAVKVRALLREDAIAEASVLPIEDVMQAWTAGMLKLSVSLDRLASRISGRLVELGIAPSHRQAAIAMVDEEVLKCRTETIAAYGESVYESEQGEEDPRRDRGAGTDAPAADDREPVG